MPAPVRRPKKKPVLFPSYSLSQATTDQLNGDNSLANIMNTDAYQLSKGNVGADGYIDGLMPYPKDYRPMTYYNDVIKQDVGVLYNPKTGDIKSDGSSVSDALTDPNMAPILDMTRKSVEQKYVSDMTPALQRPDALDMAQTSKPAPNMRADALDLPQTTNPDMGVDDYSKSGDERDFTRMNATNAYDVANMYNKPALEAINPNDDRYDFVNRNQAEEPVLDYNPSEENDFINPNGTNAYDVASMYGGNPNEFPKDQAMFTGQEMPTGARLDPYMEIPQTDVPEGVLSAKGGAEPKGNGILNTDTTSSSDRKGSAVSANARGSMMPFAKINRNEMLMRMGAKMMAGSTQGYGAAMDAAFSEYGNIKDANRQAETDAFNKAEATRLAEERIAALKAKAKATKTDSESVGNLRYGVSKLQNGLEMIRGAKGNLTGVNAGAIFSRIYGKAVGSEAEAQRLFLKELGLDAIMKRVSQTKGAISNAEMKLFAASAPDINSQEIVWEKWIERQIQMSNILINRLETGGSVDENAKLSDTMPSIDTSVGTTGTTNDDNALYNEADAIIG